MNLDFTYNKYAEIIKTVSESSYKPITIRDHIANSNLPQKCIIIRHDVDLDPSVQIKFAELENSYGIKTSYYFRYIEKIYKKKMINKVFALGHEIGYHYEVITKAKGDSEKAIEIFQDELLHFQKNWNCVTICPHGGSFLYNVDGYSLKDIIKLIPKLLTKSSVFSSWNNSDIWSKYNFKDFKILGDAYKSIDFTNVLYLSDTGRSWDNRYKRLDIVNSQINPKFDIRNTDEIIDVIKKGLVDKIYLLVHFEQWKDNFRDWLSWYAAQIIRRTGKKIIFKMKRKQEKKS